MHAIDANQTQFVLGFDQGGLTSAQARSVVADLDQAIDVVALTVARTFRARSCTSSISFAPPNPV